MLYLLVLFCLYDFYIRQYIFIKENCQVCIMAPIWTQVRSVTPRIDPKVSVLIFLSIRNKEK